MTLRDWRIFRWALMHSPQECQIEFKFLNLSSDFWDFDDGAILNLNLDIHLPPKISIYVPYETRRLYEIKVEGITGLSVDDIPF